MYRGGPFPAPVASELQVDDVVRLRHVTIDDAKQLFDLVDANREHLSAALSWVDKISTVEDEELALSHFVAEREKGAGAYWIIDKLFSADHFSPIGMVSINWVDNHNNHCLLGFWTGKDQSGKGTVTKCLRRVVHYCFIELGLNRVALEIPTDNAASRKIATRLGFWCEGTLVEKQKHSDRYRDVWLYAMTFFMWKPHN